MKINDEIGSLSFIFYIDDDDDHFYILNGHAYTLNESLPQSIKNNYKCMIITHSSNHSDHQLFKR